MSEEMGPGEPGARASAGTVRQSSRSDGLTGAEQNAHPRAGANEQESAPLAVRDWRQNGKRVIRPGGFEGMAKGSERRGKSGPKAGNGRGAASSLPRNPAAFSRASSGPVRRSGTVRLLPPGGNGRPSGAWPRSPSFRFARVRTDVWALWPRSVLSAYCPPCRKRKRESRPKPDFKRKVTSSARIRRFRLRAPAGIVQAVRGK